MDGVLDELKKAQDAVHVELLATKETRHERALADRPSKQTMNSEGTSIVLACSSELRTERTGKG